MSKDCTRTIEGRAAMYFLRLLDDRIVTNAQLDSLKAPQRDRLRALRDQPPETRGDHAMTWPDVEEWLEAVDALGPDGQPAFMSPNDLLLDDPEIDPEIGSEMEPLSAWAGVADRSPPPKSAAPEPVAPRPKVAITPDEHAVIEAVAEALAADARIFHQGPRLVRVVGESWPMGGAFAGGSGPRVEGLPPTSIRTAITRVVRLVREGENRSSWPVHPPAWLSKAIWTRGRWDDLEGARPLLAVVESPTLRPDGSVLDRPGYDPSSGLLFRPDRPEFPPIPAAPSRAEAVAAAGRLLALTDEFPYLGPADHSVWLALVLTLAGRYAIDGPTPLVWFDASDRGCGKTTLAELAALIATGRIPPVRNLPTTPEEWPKAILAIARSAVRLVLFDNAPNGSTIGDGAFDAALTATSVAGRLLGTMEELTPTPLSCTWSLTGNNLSLGGDLIRRTLRCRLVSHDERPELRGGYRIPDLLGYTRTHRSDFLRDALIILRGHAAAGRPGHGLSRLGRFEAWDDVIRAAITWAGVADPAATIDTLREEDERTSRESALIAGWADLNDPQGRGFTIAEVLKYLRDYPMSYPALREVIACYQGRNDRETARRVGEAISHVRDKVRNGQRLVRARLVHGNQRWRAESVTPKPEGGRVGQSPA